MYVSTVKCLSILLCCIIFSWTHAHGHEPYESLADIFQGQLADLADRIPPTDVAYRGGQKFGVCCYLAVNESLEIQNGTLAFRPGQSALVGDIRSFESHQFPCDAVYNGSAADQPQVWVSYSWCNRMCPGWGISSPNKLSAWVQPLIAFIFPSVIFVLNVPRRQKLGFPKSLFPQRLISFPGNITLIYRVPAVSFLVAFDTLIWLAMVLSLAGPLLLSGTYEALLDLRTLRYLDSRLENNALTVRRRAHLLLIILLGNLDREPAWEHSKQVIKNLPDENIRGKLAYTAHSSSGSLIWPVEAENKREVDSVKLKLNCILQSQIDFGSSVGAPILFYTGSFLYAIMDIRSRYGDG